MAVVCLPDFDNKDFERVDYLTHIIRDSLNYFLFDKWPRYFKENDTFKDSKGRGLLERYVNVIGDEIDQEVIPYIECVMNILDLDLTTTEYLDYISNHLGTPPDIFLNLEQYRNILSNIFSVYQVKGTKASYDILFALLGYTITITEHFVTGSTIEFYDSGVNYDTNGAFYDVIGTCNICTEYTVTVTPIETGVSSLPSETLEKFNLIIDFCQPINSKLREIIFNPS